MRTFVIGDIHGAYKAMMQCFERSGFNYKKDRLICLGDVCDRGTEVVKVFDELLKIKNLVYILGNHDLWALEWAGKGISSKIWKYQGGKKTINSYPNGMPEKHLKILLNAHYYFKEDKRLFVHGGILPGKKLKKHDPSVFLWDRSLVNEAMRRRSRRKIAPITKYKEVFVGHTPTLNFGSRLPINVCELWMMDTGACFGGPLSMMNIDTKEIFQSENTNDIYA